MGFVFLSVRAGTIVSTTFTLLVSFGRAPRDGMEVAIQLAFLDGAMRVSRRCKSECLVQALLLAYKEDMRSETGESGSSIAHKDDDTTNTTEQYKAAPAIRN